MSNQLKKILSNKYIRNTYIGVLTAIGGYAAGLMGNHLLHTYSHITPSRIVMSESDGFIGFKGHTKLEITFNQKNKGYSVTEYKPWRETIKYEDGGESGSLDGSIDKITNLGSTRNIADLALDNATTNVPINIPLESLTEEELGKINQKLKDTCERFKNPSISFRFMNFAGALTDQIYIEE